MIVIWVKFNGLIGSFSRQKIPSISASPSAERMNA
jgi:hypothetical protein